ncbi:MAG: DNA mismatch repair protein MutS [Nitrospirae bacterium]|nr:DNA mismatch repair protein MutS [Nitrospirota bacterium]MBI3351583.1 DNA mismatch repair protein MutS [Nitrospirota bacterium]
MDNTPLMRQYLEIKKNYPDAILLFRVGDFYEMFFEDAVSASKILNIALTSRDKSKENPVPLCGIPFHALNNYLAKLIKSGLQVALCEQIEDPRLAKGIVKREVVRVISPATLIESELLESQTNNYFASVCFNAGIIGLAYLDISTGDFNCVEFKEESSDSDLCKELNALLPKEILMPEESDSNPGFQWIKINQNWKIHRLPADSFAFEKSYSTLLQHFNLTDLSGFDCENQKTALCAAGTLLSYLLNMIKSPLDHVIRLKRIRSETFMVMDPSTHKSLDLFQNTYDGKREHSLLWVFDQNQTPMGSRLLKKWMTRPLIHKEEIEGRYEAVEFFYTHFESSQRIKSELKSIHDVERIVSRITLKGCNGRDFLALKASLPPLKSIQKLLQIPLPLLIEDLVKKWDNLEDLYRLIDEAISEEPPFLTKEGFLFKEGYSSELDELKSLGRNMKSFITSLEIREKEQTGIDSLKIRYNQVAGYYIEIPKGKLDRVPAHYQRKQTLTNAERYTISELSEFEIKINEAEKSIKEVEQALFEKIRRQISVESARILAMADTLSILDLLNTFAEIARENHYVRPVIKWENGLKIVEGRHPVIEKILPTGQFVPNDTFLSENNQMMIITGPNMAGKSTYMRQVALIVIMAQMGSFVPARECAIGMVDRMYTRIGAADYLTQGQSTFMVEMTEAANILTSATSKSLIILDEIGRGTSTYDGISIAWAIAEYILKNLHTRTLFATHYLELTGLALSFNNVQNYNISVKEWNDEIIFLRKIVTGIADRSYGIQVARLAGIPPEVIQRSKEVLENLEGETLDPNGLPKISHSHAGEESPLKDTQVDLFLSNQEDPHDQIIDQLKKIDPLNLTPLEALNFIHHLKMSLEKRENRSR